MHEDLSSSMELRITRYTQLEIERSYLDRARSRFRATGRARIKVNGQKFLCCRGAWATWIPALGAKFLNAKDGLLDCLHNSAPSRKEIFDSGTSKESYGPYSREDWLRAYSTKVSRRVAENIVAAQRLHRAGLGPKVLGVCVALRWIDATRGAKGHSAGFMSEDVWDLPPKEPASAAEFLAAGVRLDRLGSALRQQVNGYIVDLNAAVGVMPTDAEDELAELEARIVAAISGADEGGHNLLDADNRLGR